MRTVRIPLAAFTVNSSQVELAKLKTITFRFDRTVSCACSVPALPVGMRLYGVGTGLERGLVCRPRNRRNTHESSLV